MTGITHNADARCPDCGNSEAIVRVRGNAISSVCTGCRRADVGPMLEGDDLGAVTPDLEGDLFELDAIRYGDPTPLQRLTETDAELQRIRGHMRALGDSIDATLPPLSIRESIAKAAALVEASHYQPDLQLQPSPDLLAVSMRLPVPPR